MYELIIKMRIFLTVIIIYKMCVVTLAENQATDIQNSCGL